MDEAGIKTYFKTVNLPRMKKFLEGRGLAIDEKYGEAKSKYMGASVLIATNEIPLSNVC